MLPLDFCPIKLPIILFFSTWHIYNLNRTKHSKKKNFMKSRYRQSGFAHQMKSHFYPARLSSFYHLPYIWVFCYFVLPLSFPLSPSSFLLTNSLPYLLIWVRWLYDDKASVHTLMKFTSHALIKTFMLDASCIQISIFQNITHLFLGLAAFFPTSCVLVPGLIDLVL